jgi:hypothetical protein
VFCRYFTGAVLATLSLFAQQPNPISARIEGSILDSVTAQPVKKAAVTLREAGSHETEGLVALTDQAGHFEFPNLPAGSWSAEVQREGYVTLGSFDHGGPKELRWKLEPGAVVKDLTLRLTPTGVITGRVFDTDGEALAGASVSLSVPGAKKPQPLPSDRTNDLGEYRLYRVPPGRYIVSATYQPPWRQMGMHLVTRPSASGKGQPREDYETTYYPGSADASQASTVLVAAGAQASGTDIRLHRGSVVRVRGKVIGASGSGIVLILMTFEAQSSGGVSNVQNAMAKPDGSFQFDNVPPGRHLLECSAGFDTGGWRGRQWFEVGSEDIEGLQIVMNPSQKMEGKISIEDSTHLPAGLHAVLIPREANPMNQPGGYSPVRPDGSFTFDAVYDGRYDLAFGKLQNDAPDDFYVKSIRLGDEDVLNDGIDVHGPSGKLEVIVREDGGTIACKVTSENGDPAAHAKVTAVPADHRRHAEVLYGNAETDEGGECKIRGMAPGTYVVLASEDKELPDLREDETWQQMEKLGQKVEVVARGTAEVGLKLIPANPDSR